MTLKMHRNWCTGTWKFKIFPGEHAPRLHPPLLLTVVHLDVILTHNSPITKSLDPPLNWDYDSPPRLQSSTSTTILHLDYDPPPRTTILHLNYDPPPRLRSSTLTTILHLGLWFFTWDYDPPPQLWFSTLDSPPQLRFSTRRRLSSIMAAASTSTHWTTRSLLGPS